MKYNTIFENKNWLVIEPLDFEAAKDMAEGSKWCTAYKITYFEYYTKHGHVFYCHNKKDPTIKYGLHYVKGVLREYVNKACWSMKYNEKSTLPKYIERLLMKYHKSNDKLKK